MAKRVSLKGKGADLFFGDYPPVPVEADVVTTLPDHQNGTAEADAEPEQAASPITHEARDEVAPTIRAKVAKRATTPRQYPPTRSAARGSDSSVASTLASREASTIEAIRKVVKVPGREVSFVRLSADEKSRLTDIVYTYKRQGQKTSENEINRIAINYLLLDYDEHGDQSMLARVLAALLA